MKPLLFVLLAASLAANVALVVANLRSVPLSGTAAAHAGQPDSSATSAAGTATAPAGKSSEKPAARPAAAAATTTGTTGAGAPVGAVWRAATTEQDLHRVVADLRAAGYPPAVVRAVVQQLLRDRFASREPNAGQPYWKHNNQTPESIAAQAAVNVERQALLESLLGPDARPSAMMDAETRLRRYGPMSEDKIDLITKIERDYGEMSAEVWAKRKGNILNDSVMQTQQLMEQEKFADIAAVLTPEELTQYELRNSQTARTLLSKLRNLDITEAEYTRLYQVQKAFNDANPQRATTDAASYQQRQNAQLALHEETRAVLGETRFYAYLEGSDFQYANVAKVFTPYQSVTPAAIYQVYRLQNDLQSAIRQSSAGGRPSPEKMAEMRSLVEGYNTRLEALIGTEAAEAYRKQGAGQMFNSYRTVPRPPGN